MKKPNLSVRGKILGFLLFWVELSSCQSKNEQIIFTVKNNLEIARTSETISVPAVKVEALMQAFGATNLLIKDAVTGRLLVSQVLDNNADGVVDEVLFQTSIPANAEKKFLVVGSKNGATQQPKSKFTTYSRFVPERTDDYAWENDRVAFRTYGPVAQQLVEQGKPGGTLTSGIDAWLKRVNYPVINKWYKNNLQEAGYYHTDHGEGYDPYHVGASRGLGGIGILLDDSLYVSKNFITYKKIAEGPIRTIFKLTYAPWPAQNNMITEEKTISLDLGSNLTRFEEELTTKKALPNATIGITLHDQKGNVQVDPKAGWFRYWEPLDDAYLGTGLVLNPAFMQTYKDHRVKLKDRSHLYVITNPTNGKLVYYAGFGWSKSNLFKSQADWDKYLATFARCLASPLEVKF
ncbi:DUF4861 domain-containing protein [Adhaeribacter pallidiroseus]|uniref:Pectinesterase n=1 Tax=Adhaeribacter pallidiroseus TaxID=2072847 RepID=A0A369QJL8_9BACT|nr:DUF4861 domain-containing protein [Adhaeribacter pallidiroseus]RDC63416.1 Pectinesterase [Adhaeribacter pallidiroseus]